MFMDCFETTVQDAIYLILYFETADISETFSLECVTFLLLQAYTMFMPKMESEHLLVSSNNNAKKRVLSLFFLKIVIISTLLDDFTGLFLKYSISEFKNVLITLHSCPG